MYLTAVPPHAVDAAWPRVAPWIKAACWRTGCDLTPDDLKRLCRGGQAQLITIHDAFNRSVAAGVTQVRNYESGIRSCWVLAIGGTGARLWRGTLETIEAGARANGCHRVEFVGRRGWSRLLPTYRAELCETGMHYVKDLP